MENYGGHHGDVTGADWTYHSGYFAVGRRELFALK